MIDLLGRRKEWERRWERLALSQKFVVAGAAFTVAAMLLSGLITTTVMADNIVQRRGEAIAIGTSHIIAPAVPDLARGSLGAEARERLDVLMADDVFTAQFPYLDLWLPDGTIVYSNSPGVTGRQLALPPPVAQALAGGVVVEFSDIDAPDPLQRGFADDFVEVYFPLLDKETGKVVAIAELREITRPLDDALWSLTIASWTTVAVVSIVVMLGLFGIVAEGSRTIERQQRTLSKRLKLTHARAAHLRQLKEDAVRASRSVTELTDLHLRTVGTDLHDGPAQSISFAMLKLEQIRHAPKSVDRSAVVAEVEDALSGALGEIRAIAVDFVLPDIAHLNLRQVIDHAVSQHTRRTGITVSVDTRVEPVHVEPEVAICVFRFIQEGLNNAFHHGLPEGQAAVASLQGGVLKLSISNNYIVGEHSKHSDHPGLGLYGLRARVQSVGGNFTFVQENGQTRIEMWLRGV
ncbi:sensor histidine kinase [Devosia sp.]|uniref:sensor histidine kinase n=1 Tax=Devosia sp. TaxID=1871048 RepID=UPI002FCC691C